MHTELTRVRRSPVATLALARERLGALRPQNATFDGQFEIPTFEEVIRCAGS